MVRQNETKRADDVGSDLPEDFALDQGLADQPKLVIFEIAQAAMHELGRPGRRPTSQVVHFAEENRVTPARRIPCDAAAIDAAPNNSQVENPIRQSYHWDRLSFRRYGFRFGVKHSHERKQHRSSEM